MSTLRHAGILHRELVASAHIPYSVHVAPNVVRTVQGDYVQTFRLDGASFESADDEQLNTWHERLNVLWRNIATPQLSVWAHVVRRRQRPAEKCVEGGGFTADLQRSYERRLADESLMVNELYLSLVFRPLQGRAENLAGRLLSKASRHSANLELPDSLEHCAKLADTVQASLDRYEPRPLGVYVEEGRIHSELLEIFGLLINGERAPVPLPRCSLDQVLATSRLFFGTETIEYRMATATRIGAMLGIKEYPTPTSVGMFNLLLAAPFEFVLTQSFTFLTKGTSQALLQRQFNRMLNAGDFAVSQADELKDALDALTSNEFVMGDHHCSLQVLADVSFDGTKDEGHRLRLFNEQVALARSLLADTGMAVAREDLALEPAFWAQLPGSLAMRPRKAAITSRNFAAMVPFHNYPTGRAEGNHWGQSLTVLMTSASSPYHFSLHASDPAEAGGGSRKDTGHTLICGPTGSGKTVFIGFLVALLSRRQATQVIFDKDHGLEILVRALGGAYLPLKSGEPMGFNPLQLPAEPEHLEFLKNWLRMLVRPASGVLTTREETDLDLALRGTMALDAPNRRLSRLIEFLDAAAAEGCYARLARWCESTGGDYAWVFDHASDSVVPRLASQSIVAFDVTSFLDHEVIRSPITVYLFHLVRQLLDGRRLVCWMDEFWRLLADPAFENFAKDGPKTWRKLNGVMCLATQSVGDVLDSPISRTIIEQTPTKVFFPNVDASRDDYVEGLGLSEREFKLIKEQMAPGSRQFLIKQGHHSIVCTLDLKGFDAQLRVISGRRSEVDRMRELIAALGDEPACWLPQFMGE